MGTSPFLPEYALSNLHNRTNTEGCDREGRRGTSWIGEVWLGFGLGTMVILYASSLALVQSVPAVGGSEVGHGRWEGACVGRL